MQGNRGSVFFPTVSTCSDSMWACDKIDNYRKKLEGGREEGRGKGRGEEKGEREREIYPSEPVVASQTSQVCR